MLEGYLLKQGWMFMLYLHNIMEQGLFTMDDFCSFFLFSSVVEIFTF